MIERLDYLLFNHGIPHMFYKSNQTINLDNLFFQENMRKSKIFRLNKFIFTIKNLLNY